MYADAVRTAAVIILHETGSVACRERGANVAPAPGIQGRGASKE